MARITQPQARYERDILINLMLYCGEHLKLNNAQIGRIFRRGREDVGRIIDKSKPKPRTR